MSYTNSFGIQLRVEERNRFNSKRFKFLSNVKLFQ
jgi:hypothetical protein